MVIGEVRFGNLTKSRSRRDGTRLTRKRDGAWTHWCRRDSVAKSRSWESAVFWGGGRICGSVNFGTIKIVKRTAAWAMCDKFSEGTQEGCGIGGWRVGTTVCKN